MITVKDVVEALLKVPQDMEIMLAGPSGVGSMGWAYHLNFELRQGFGNKYYVLSGRPTLPGKEVFSDTSGSRTDQGSAGGCAIGSHRTEKGAPVLSGLGTRRSDSD